jgi:hypothetical protein
MALVRRFNHRAPLDTLAEGRDALDGLYSNTQIPKVIGSAPWRRRPATTAARALRAMTADEARIEQLQLAVAGAAAVVLEPLPQPAH